MVISNDYPQLLLESVDNYLSYRYLGRAIGNQ